MKEYNPEILQFNLEKWEDPLDQANAVLQFILNRAYKSFVDSGKPYLVIENYSGDMQDFAALHICSMISTFSMKPVYVRRKMFTKMKWMKKLNSNIHLVGKKPIESLKKDGFIFSVFSAHDDLYYKHHDDDYNHIDDYLFEGIDPKFIKVFTTGFYGYDAECSENQP